MDKRIEFCKMPGLLISVYTGKMRDFFQQDDKVEAEEAFNAKRDKFTDFDAARKASKAKDSKDSNADSTSKTGDSKEKKGSKDKDGMALGDEADDMDDDDENKETVVEDCFPPICMKKYVSTFSEPLIKFFTFMRIYFKYSILL